MSHACSKCGRTEGSRIVGDGAHRIELRPYGKGGALVCFDCGMADEQTTAREYGRRLEAASVLTGAAQLSPRGPIPRIMVKGFAEVPRG